MSTKNPHAAPLPKLRRHPVAVAMALGLSTLALVPTAAHAQQPGSTPESTLQTVDVIDTPIEANPNAEPGVPYKAKYSGDERHKRALAETAQNIQVLTKAQIEDSGYTDLREILDAQPGITLGTGENGNAFGDRYVLQGLIDSGNDSEANKRRMEQIRQTYVGYLDPVTLVARAKLTLNRNNNSYFQDYLVPLGHLPQRGLRASEHLLRKAFEWFDRRVAEYLKKSTGTEGMRLAQFVEDMSDRLFFTMITVTDELNAYKVFETLNARGVRLSATDLLKNYLFSVLDRGRDIDHELRNLEERWEAMVGRLGSESFPDFLRMDWNSRESFARQSELFRDGTQPDQHSRKGVLAIAQYG